MAQKIRVMVVDDSIVFRSFLIKGISEDPRFEVVGFAVNALDAKGKLPTLKPDIMTLDIEMPGMTGLEFLKEVLPSHPVPVILVSSLNVRVFDALAAGAVDFVRKPGTENGAREQFMASLRAKLAIGANAKPRLPVSSVAGHAPAQTVNTAMAPRAAGSAHSPIISATGMHPSVDVIAIGASTGGTEAILEVVRQFPARMPGIVITQHMPSGFTSMYAERLNKICKLEVREAKHGDKVQPGLILLAPGGLQMRVVRMGSGYAVSCTEEEKVSGHRPSVDVLFDSVATHVRSRAIGVILTGMGADGAAGMLRMRRAGAYTIGQDRESCVVYGMPMEAFKIGAVCMQAPLGSIHNAVLARLAKG
ncbi:MAG: chemotaxis response regulator protein-glutamate methylesterase [Lachnospiraceae bacterium]|jgi:two-component system chemotaxis response regulator CheB|nr:chemotaxis response regulator protein-glutamate methylesterase [Lachnospiraceae bacterium]MCI9133523.1 chemotaxis response regulator protein-glutamate methylesterase [Lachnospiraceae bacterium]